MEDAPTPPSPKRGDVLRYGAIGLRRRDHERRAQCERDLRRFRTNTTMDIRSKEATPNQLKRACPACHDHGVGRIRSERLFQQWEEVLKRPGPDDGVLQNGLNV